MAVAAQLYNYLAVDQFLLRPRPRWGAYSPPLAPYMYVFKRPTSEDAIEYFLSNQLQTSGADCRYSDRNRREETSTHGERKSSGTTNVRQLKIVSPAIWRRFAILRQCVRSRRPGFMLVGQTPDTNQSVNERSASAATLSIQPQSSIAAACPPVRRRQRSGDAQLSLIYVTSGWRTTRQVPHRVHPLQAADVTARWVQVCNYQRVPSNRRRRCCSS